MYYTAGKKFGLYSTDKRQQNKSRNSNTGTEDKMGEKKKLEFS